MKISNYNKETLISETANLVKIFEKIKEEYSDAEFSPLILGLN